MPAPRILARLAAGWALGLAAVAIAPAQAPAATVALSDLDTPGGRAVSVVFRAAPREFNKVRVVVGAGPPVSYRLIDTASRLHPLAGCTSLNVHQVVCTERPVAAPPPGTPDRRVVTILLGDRNDILGTPLGASPPGLVVKGNGGSGADSLAGREIHGGPGNDLIFGVLTPGGVSHLYGDGGADRIGGSAGADLLSGGLGDDILAGGAGNDVLIGGPGTDLLFGGPGVDRLDGRIRDRARG